MSFVVLRGVGCYEFCGVMRCRVLRGVGCYEVYGVMR